MNGYVAIGIVGFVAVTRAVGLRRIASMLTPKRTYVVGRYSVVQRGDNMELDPEEGVLVTAIKGITPEVAQWVLSQEHVIRFFNKWTTKGSPVKISEFSIQSATPFGAPKTAKAGFATVAVSNIKTTRDKKQIRGVDIVFFRNDAVSMFIVVIFQGKFYLLLVSQLRLANTNIPHPADTHPYPYEQAELVAGMLDKGSKNYTSLALEEAKQEVGVVISADNCVVVGREQHPSVGACNERIPLVTNCNPIPVSPTKFHKLITKQRGLEAEGESTACFAVPFTSLREYLLVSSDMKINAAVATILCMSNPPAWVADLRHNLQC
jgi:hypothetical protein